MRPIASLSLVAALFAIPAAAQSTARNNLPVAAGERVRGTTSSQRVAGTLLSVTADSLLLSDGGGRTTALARSDLTRLEVSSGVRTHKLVYGSIGLALGAVTGLALGGWSASGSDDGDLGPVQAVATATGAVAGAMVGALVGGAAGVFLGARGKERWQAVQADGNLPGAVLIPSRSGASLALSLRF